MYLSGDFRNSMGNISKELMECNIPALVYNEMLPNKSFFALPRELYIKLLYLADLVEEADEVRSFLDNQDNKVKKKYKAMVRKRYEKDL